MWHVGDGMGWWMLWGGLMMLLFWGAIIALVVWAVQSLGHREEAPGQPSAPRRTPLDIARERYARGDISREEFEQIKRDLEETL
jgi:putative membrane protein